MKTKQKKIEILSTLLRKFFKIMSSNSLDEEERSRKLDIIRFKIERYKVKYLLEAASLEVETSRSFVYTLFLQNIKFARKI